MLKSSPLLNSSANASPTTFRHASSTGPFADPASSTAHATGLRRPSSRSASSTSTSVTSPASSRLNRHDSMDSPSVPGLHRRPSSQSIPPPPQLPPPSPRSEPEPMAKNSAATSPALAPPPQSAAVAASASTSIPASVSAPPAPIALSPNKRRISPSQSQHANQPAESIPGTLPQNPSLKRAKPEEQPPKVLPKEYEFCPVEDMVELISQMLAELIATNDAIRISNGGLTRFHSRTAPGISVRDYLQRLARHATLPPPLLLVMVYYIDRLCAMYPEFTINTLTVHRFLITAATVAAKGLSDSFWNNTTYARVGGVRVAELKLLELEFLHRVDWKIVPNPEVLVAYYKGLVERTPGYVLETNDSSEDSIDGDGDEGQSESPP